MCPITPIEVPLPGQTLRSAGMAAKATAKAEPPPVAALDAAQLRTLIAEVVDERISRRTDHDTDEDLCLSNGAPAGLTASEILAGWTAITF